jgi:hypothetical protein
MPANVSKEVMSKAIKAGAENSATAPWKTKSSAFRGLLWAEWFAHSKLLLIFLGLWLVAVWVLPLFAHPGWILVMGGFYALLAGPAYGGGDVLEGCEEFSFALPATRSERYLARVIVGGGTLLLLTAINLLALGLDVPDILARLYIDTGILQPKPLLKTGLLYGLVLALPLAVFALSFVLSAATRSRAMVLSAWFWGVLGALVLLQLGFWYEELVWDSLTGFFSCPLLLGAAGVALWSGLRVYQRKEIGPPSIPITLPGRWWLWMILFLLGVCIALALVSSLIKNYPKFIAAS